MNDVKNRVAKNPIPGICFQIFLGGMLLLGFLLVIAIGAAA